MKRASAVAIGVAMGFMGVSAFAQKVSIPREGNYEFVFCAIGETRLMSSGEEVFVNQYKVIANTRSQATGKAFDRMSALCLGVYARVNGRHQEDGVCEMTDMDGDKWWMHYKGHPDGSGGTYTSAHGSGKYAGMALKGEYILDFWPSAEKGVIQSCNLNKGTYKLK